MSREIGKMCGYCDHYKQLTKTGSGKCCLIGKPVLDITPSNKREGCQFINSSIEDELLEKIKNGRKLTSEDLNSNDHTQFDGLESLTEDGKKWFSKEVK